MSTVGADDANFSFEAIEGLLKRHLGVEDDHRLKRWYSFARVSATNFLANPFTDDDGADVTKTEDEIEVIRYALFEGVRAQRDQAQKTPGLMAVSTGAASETYGAASGAGSIARTAMAQILYDLALSIERF